jgi:hypothetical protein
MPKKRGAVSQEQSVPFLEEAYLRSPQALSGFSLQSRYAET